MNKFHESKREQSHHKRMGRKRISFWREWKDRTTSRGWRYHQM